MEKELKLAILIDAENISHKYIATILNEAKTIGNVIYKRIYGNWTNSQMNSWKNSILDNAIQPIQQYNNTKGKNSTDSALIIDAMDLLYQSNLDGFCIISSDSDFTRLASRLRESEKYVLGMGESKTPRSFISACNKFLYLDLLFQEKDKKAGRKEHTSESEEESIPDTQIEEPTDVSSLKNGGRKASTTTIEKENKPNPADQDSPSGKDLETITDALKNLVEENSNDDGWIFSGSLGNLITKQFSDFDVRNFGYKKFVPFIESLNLFETKKTPDSENKSIKHFYFKVK